MTAIAVSTFGTTNPTTNPTPSTTTEIKSTVTLSNFTTLLPFIKIYQSIEASKKICDYDSLLKNPIVLKVLNQQLLNQLSQNPIITLSSHQQRLSNDVLQDIYILCKELHISIEESIVLYYESRLDDTVNYLIDKGVLSKKEDVKVIARTLYYYERGCYFKSVLFILKHRIDMLEDEYDDEFMMVTDGLLNKGLISSLIRTIQELTELANKLKSASISDLQQIEFHERVLEYRQDAAECLFYALYHVQGTSNEISSLLDVTRDLSNMLTSVDTSKQEGWSEISRREGYSQLLQCVNTLIITVLVSLDNTHELWDRNVHKSNVFGVGNALLPPPQCDISPNLDTVHAKLTNDNGWNKKDIWGLFSSAYALLVFPHYSTNSDRNVLSDTSFRQCLSSALTCRSFWYARCGVLSIPSSVPLFPFISTVLSEFTCHYLNVVSACGDFPISYVQWRRDKIEEMELRRVQEEQNRQLMGFLSGGSMRSSLNYDYKIDYSTRPDCLEDIMSLVIHLCHVYPPCSAHMWSIPEDNMMYPPIASQLQVMSQEDHSVVSWYFHYLSILTFHSDEAAKKIFSLWTSTTDAWNVKRCVTAIQWYITKLTPVDSVVTATTPTPNSSNYYYGTDPSSSDVNNNNPVQNTTKELLQPDGIFFLSSVLQLLTNLLLRCRVEMQNYILQSRDEDLSCLLSTLFKLVCVVPNKHDVLRTISALVQYNRQACLQAWNLLEDSQVLPTRMLSQYPIINYPNIPLPLRKKRDTLLYELDQHDGSYLINEEFLGLVYTLITYGGCPPSLGGDRRRPGIAPYIEYVTTHLLPKVMSSNMHHASIADKYRLISKLLDVLLATLQRFILPTKESINPIAPVTKEMLQQIQFAFYKLFRSDIGTTIHYTQFTNDDLEEMTAILHDFKDDVIAVPTTPMENVNTLNLPRPKTPAFCILSNLLACHDYQVLYSLLYLLADNSSLYHQQLNDHLSIALLLLDKDYPRDDTSPRILKNRDSMVLSKYSSIYSIPQLQYVPHKEEYDFIPYFDLVSWKERTIANILSILTHVIVREQAFVSLLQSNGVSSTIVPVLRFQEDNRHFSTNGALEMYQVCVTSRSSQLWMAASGAKHIFRHSNPILALVEYMSYISFSPSSNYEDTITTLSTYLFSYLCETVPMSEISNMIPRENLIAQALARHLTVPNATNRLIVMKLLLSSPSLSASFLTSPKNECVQALIDILDKNDFLSIEDDSLLLFFHRAYELLCKLTTTPTNIISITLRKCDFWYRQVRFYGRQLKKSLPSDGYHTLAWLFKGFANELFSCKANTHEVHQHHRLLSLLLLSDEHDVSILQAFLGFLPLSSFTPSVTSPPSFLSSDAISASTTPLSSRIGEGEPFFSLYSLVDSTALLYTYAPVNDSDEKIIQSWCWNWNKSISLACASTHVCHALEMIMSVLSLTWNESRTDLITDLIIKTLLRINDMSSGVSTYMALVPLSTSILSLVDILVSTTTDAMQVEDVLVCAFLVAKVITFCPATSVDNSQSDYYNLCISRLSSSLSSLLTLSITLAKNKENILEFYVLDVVLSLGPIIGNYKTDVYFITNTFLSVASSLSLVCCRKASPDVTNVRICMRSIIKFFNELESSSTPSQKTFLYRLLNNDNQGKDRLAKFTSLINGYDPDVCTTLLQQIAMCKHGSTLLFQGGVSTALVETARKATLDRPKEFYMTETYGAVQLDPPNYFEGHLVLLSTMLSSDLSHDSRNRLMKEVTRFLTWSFPIGDSLLRSFPRNIGITRAYLFLLSLTAPVFDTPQSKKELSRLEKRVIDLAYHIAAHPLPISVLPPLPNELFILGQQQQLELSQYGEVESANSCWWDLLTVSDQGQLPIPYPFTSLPSSSYLGLFNTRQYAMNTNKTSNPWTQQKYTYAISAMKSLESLLLFIQQRVSSSNMNLNGISIAKGLYRCVELCRNIQRYSDSITSNNIDSGEPWKRIEHDSLNSLSFILKRCSNILLVIIDTYLRSQMSENNTIVITANTHSSFYQMEKPNCYETLFDGFCKPISLVMLLLKIEINGIDSTSNKEEMSKLVSIIQRIKNQISKAENA